MTRAEWDEVEKVLDKPDVQIAMRGRCEEQGHQFDNGADFTPFPRVFSLRSVREWRH
jgi:hypothetical protein